MEDAATAEISRSQLWQWRTYGIKTDQGVLIDRPYYEKLRTEEVAKLDKLKNKMALARAVELTDELVWTDQFIEFLTLPAYDILLNLTRPKL